MSKEFAEAWNKTVSDPKDRFIYIETDEMFGWVMQDYAFKDAK